MVIHWTLIYLIDDPVKTVEKLALKQKDFENLSRKIETNDEAIENCENEIERAKKKIAELKKDSENIDSEMKLMTSSSCLVLWLIG